MDCLQKIKVSGGQDVIKIDKKSIKNPFKIGAQFLMHLGGQHGSQNPPKTRPKSIQNRWKMDIKIDQTFSMHFEWPFSGSWGQHGSKILPKSCPGGWGKCSLFLGLEGLGGVLGPLGAQEPILIDLWLYFDRCLLIFDWSKAALTARHSAIADMMLLMLMLLMLMLLMMMVMLLLHHQQHQHNQHHMSNSAVAGCWRSLWYMYIYIYTHIHIYIYMYRYRYRYRYRYNVHIDIRV